MKKFLRTFALMAMMLPFAMQAQVTLTVADGEVTNGYVPVYGFYADAYLKAHFVYPSTMLTDMSGGTISQMTFYATQDAVDWEDATFAVYLGEVSSTAINDFVDVALLTQVYEGSLTIAGGMMIVEFDNDYTYGGGNLLVAVENTVEGHYVTSTWYGVEASNASYQGYSYSSLSEVSGSQRNFLPKVTFSYDIGPACAAPTALTASNVTDNSATITWSSTAPSFVFEYKAATASTWTTQNLTVTTANLSNLTPNTEYNIRVKAVCDAELQSDYAVSGFTTLPQGMIIIGESTGSSEYLPVYTLYNYAFTQQIYTSAEFGEAGTVSSVGFYNTGTEKTRNLDIYMVSTDKSSFENTTDWVAVTESDLVFSGEVVFTSGSWTDLTFTTPFVYDGTSNVILVVDDNNGTWSSGLSCSVFEGIDQSLEIHSDGTDYDPADPSTYDGNIRSVKNVIRIAKTAIVCDPVTNVTVSNVTDHSATVAWTPAMGQTSWEIDYGPAGHTAGNGTVVATSANPYALTGLADNSHYDVYVRAICGSSTSPWSAVANINTLDINSAVGSPVSIFPNPASSNVTISGIEGEATVMVVDMNGRTVFTAKANESLTIDLAGFAQGAYFVRISGEQTMAIRKLIVK